MPLGFRCEIPHEKNHDQATDDGSQNHERSPGAGRREQAGIVFDCRFAEEEQIVDQADQGAEHHRTIARHTSNDDCECAQHPKRIGPPLARRIDRLRGHSFVSRLRFMDRIGLAPKPTAHFGACCRVVASSVNQNESRIGRSWLCAGPLIIPDEPEVHQFRAAARPKPREGKKYGPSSRLFSRSFTGLARKGADAAGHQAAGFVAKSVAAVRRLCHKRDAKRPPLDGDAGTMCVDDDRESLQKFDGRHEQIDGDS